MEKNDTDILYYDGRIIFVEFNYRFLCGVVGLIRNYWDAGSLSMLIFSQVSGGIFVKELLKNDYIYLSKKELEKYKFLGKGFFLTGIVLLLMFLIIYL